MTVPTPLPEPLLTTRLESLDGWEGDGHGITRTFRFASFKEAVSFMHACVPTIDALDHHPVWTNTYHRVEVRLSTADAGHRVTERDLTLAAALNEAYAARG